MRHVYLSFWISPGKAVITGVLRTKHSTAGTERLNLLTVALPDAPYPQFLVAIFFGT